MTLTADGFLRKGEAALSRRVGSAARLVRGKCVAAGREQQESTAVPSVGGAAETGPPPGALASGKRKVMSASDGQQLEYEQVARLLGALDETRFRLLAFVPTIAGAAVGLISGRPPAVDLLAIGLLGLAATMGILVYELRNSQVASGLSAHAGRLERALHFDGPALAQHSAGGTRLFGLIGLSRGRGLALVYAAALAGWSYLTAWGMFRAFELVHARSWGLLVGGGIGLLVFLEVERIEEAVREVTPSP